MKHSIAFYTLVLTIILGFLSCRKTERVLYEPAHYETINTSVTCYQTIYDLVKLCDSVAALPSFSAGGLTPFTKDSLNGYITAHINYGDTLKRNTYKRLRSGKIEVQYKKPYYVAGSTFSVTLNKYSVNGNQFNGSLTYSIVAPTTYTNLNTKRYFKIEWNGISVKNKSIACKLNGSFDLTSSNQFQKNYIKGKLSITEGNTFTFDSEIKDSLYITGPYYYAGKVYLKNTELDAVINYGDNQNDNFATATAEEFRYIINLEDY